jgi:hypothetical protein
MLDLVRDQVQEECKEPQVEQPKEVPGCNSEEAEQAEEREQGKPTSFVHGLTFQIVFVEPDTRSVLFVPVRTSPGCMRP